jgi:hypothetical protein
VFAGRILRACRTAGTSLSERMYKGKAHNKKQTSDKRSEGSEVEKELEARCLRRRSEALQASKQKEAAEKTSKGKERDHVAPDSLLPYWTPSSGNRRCCSCRSQVPDGGRTCRACRWEMREVGPPKHGRSAALLQSWVCCFGELRLFLICS